MHQVHDSAGVREGRGRRQVRILKANVSDKPIANRAADAGGAGQADTNLQPTGQTMQNPGPANTGADGSGATADALGAQGQQQQAPLWQSQGRDLGAADALPSTVRPRSASATAIGL